MRDVLIVAALALGAAFISELRLRTEKIQTRLTVQNFDADATYFRRKWLWFTRYSADGKVWHANYFALVRELETNHASAHRGQRR